MANLRGFISSGEFLSKSPTTIEAFPLANKSLHDSIPEVVEIDTTPTLVTSMRLSTDHLFQGLPLFDRVSFPFEYLCEICDLDLHLLFCLLKTAMEEQVQKYDLLYSDIGKIVNTILDLSPSQAA
jgi:hypothetical protein